jgi:hypothetical protein
MHLLTGSSPELSAAALNAYQHACLGPPWNPDAIRVVTQNPGCLGLLRAVAAEVGDDRLALPLARALATDGDGDAAHIPAFVDLWLWLLRHRLGVTAFTDEDWGRWWRVAGSRQRAEAAVSRPTPLGQWWAAQSTHPLDPTDGPFTWWHARANALYTVPKNQTLWLQQHAVPGRVATQTMNLMVFALLNSDASTEATEAEAVVTAVRSVCLVGMLQNRRVGIDPAVAVPPATVVPAALAHAVVVAARLDAEGLFTRLQAEHTLMCIHRSMCAHGGPSWPAS